MIKKNVKSKSRTKSKLIGSLEDKAWYQFGKHPEEDLEKLGQGGDASHFYLHESELVEVAVVLMCHHSIYNAVTLGVF